MLFDGVLDRYLTLVQKLGHSSHLVEDCSFEKAIRKVQRGEESALRGAKQRSVNIFQRLDQQIETL